jgi:hypothetical protein
MQSTPSDFKERSIHSFVFEPIGSEHTRTHGFARLRSPEVHADVRHPLTENIKDEVPAWVLEGELSTETYDVFCRAGQLSASGVQKLLTDISMFETSTGTAFLVVTHQVGTHQHRFVLLLTSSKVRSFLTSLMGGDQGAGKLTFELSCPSRTQVLSMQAHWLPHAMYQSLLMAGEVPEEQLKDRHQKAIKDFPATMALAGHPDLVSSIAKGMPARHINVSTLMPEVLA